MLHGQELSILAKQSGIFDVCINEICNLENPSKPNPKLSLELFLAGAHGILVNLCTWQGLGAKDQRDSIITQLFTLKKTVEQHLKGKKQSSTHLEMKKLAKRLSLLQIYQNRLEQAQKNLLAKLYPKIDNLYACDYEISQHSKRVERYLTSLKSVLRQIKAIKFMAPEIHTLAQTVNFTFSGNLDFFHEIIRLDTGVEMAEIMSEISR